MARQTARGPTPSDQPGAGENRLLAALPRGERERLLPLADVIELVTSQALHEAGEPIPWLYWSTPPAAAGATPVGTATLRWEGASGATIEKIAWEVWRAETDVWNALEALAGLPLRPPARTPVGHDRNTE